RDYWLVSRGARPRGPCKIEVSRRHRIPNGELLTDQLVRRSVEDELSLTAPLAGLLTPNARLEGSVDECIELLDANFGRLFSSYRRAHPRPDDDCTGDLHQSTAYACLFLHGVKPKWPVDLAPNRLRSCERTKRRVVLISTTNPKHYSG